MFFHRSVGHSFAPAVGWISWDGSIKSSVQTLTPNGIQRTYNDGWINTAQVDDTTGKSILTYGKTTASNGAPLYGRIVESLAGNSLTLKTEYLLYNATNSYMNMIGVLSNSTAFVTAAVNGGGSAPGVLPISINTSTDALTAGNMTSIYGGATYDSPQAIGKISSTQAVVARSVYPSYTVKISNVTYGMPTPTIGTVDYNPVGQPHSDSFAIFSTSRGMIAGNSSSGLNTTFCMFSMSSGTINGLLGNATLSNAKGGCIVMLDSTRVVYIYSKTDNSYRVSAVLVTDNGGSTAPTIGTPVTLNNSATTHTGFNPISMTCATLVQTIGTKYYIFVAFGNASDSNYPTGMVLCVDLSNGSITHVNTTRLNADAAATSGHNVVVSRCSPKSVAVTYMDTAYVGKILATGVNL